MLTHKSAYVHLQSNKDATIKRKAQKKEVWCLLSDCDTEESRASVCLFVAQQKLLWEWTTHLEQNMEGIQLCNGATLLPEGTGDAPCIKVMMNTEEKQGILEPDMSNRKLFEEKFLVLAAGQQPKAHMPQIKGGVKKQSWTASSWPAIRSDLNPIKNLWRELKSSLAKGSPANLNERWHTAPAYRAEEASRWLHETFTGCCCYYEAKY